MDLPKSQKQSIRGKMARRILLSIPLFAIFSSNLQAETVFKRCFSGQIAMADIPGNKTQNGSNMKDISDIAPVLQDLLDQKNYFGLRTALIQNKAALDKSTCLKRLYSGSKRF